MLLFHCFQHAKFYTFDVVADLMQIFGNGRRSRQHWLQQLLKSEGHCSNTSVEIMPMHKALGRSTTESIQSGLYFGHLGGMKEVIERITKECFQNDRPTVIRTGGFSSLFEKGKFFDFVIPDLVLKGMHIALKHNS